jgi:hypothetical protein
MRLGPLPMGPVLQGPGHCDVGCLRPQRPTTWLPAHINRRHLIFPHSRRLRLSRHPTNSRPLSKGHLQIGSRTLTMDLMRRTCLLRHRRLLPSMDPRARALCLRMDAWEALLQKFGLLLSIGLDPLVTATRARINTTLIHRLVAASWLVHLLQLQLSLLLKPLLVSARIVHLLLHRSD